MSGSANVSIGGYRKDQQMSGSANVQVESANGRLAEISKCLSQQMSKSSKQKSRQQLSVDKSPVGKWKIGVSSNAVLEGARKRHVRKGEEIWRGGCATHGTDLTQAVKHSCALPSKHSISYFKHCCLC